MGEVGQMPDVGSGYGSFHTQPRASLPRRRALISASLALGLVFAATLVANQASLSTEQLKLLNFRDFDIAGSYFNPPPPPKQQVDIYVTPEGDVRSVIFSGNIPS